MNSLKIHNIPNYTTTTGAEYEAMDISYEVFGKALHSAPVVIVNHALTGNSDVLSEDKGWWKGLIGSDKLIDINKYTIIAFNIPGNGYDGHLIDNYKDFTTRDIATLFYKVLSEIKVEKVFAIIGGSLGGGIAWEIACLYPDFSDFIIPIASDWKSSDWVIAHNSIQESLLQNSKEPLEDARKMAMLFYRTPGSFSQKFNRTKTDDNNTYNVVSWLNHHGQKIKGRFELKAYLLMNHLLTSINIESEGVDVKETLSKINATIIQISVDSDLFFVAEENIKTKKILDELQIPNQYHEINSIQGHDAFLIEHEQITEFLRPVFN